MCDEIYYAVISCNFLSILWTVTLTNFEAGYLLLKLKHFDHESKYEFSEMISSHCASTADASSSESRYPLNTRIWYVVVLLDFAWWWTGCYWSPITISRVENLLLGPRPPSTTIWFMVKWSQILYEVAIIKETTLL